MIKLQAAGITWRNLIRPNSADVTVTGTGLTGATKVRFEAGPVSFEVPATNVTATSLKINLTTIAAPAENEYTATVRNASNAILDTGTTVVVRSREVAYEAGQRVLSGNAYNRTQRLFDASKSDEPARAMLIFATSRGDFARTVNAGAMSQTFVKLPDPLDPSFAFQCQSAWSQSAGYSNMRSGFRTSTTKIVCGPSNSGSYPTATLTRDAQGNIDITLDSTDRLDGINIGYVTFKGRTVFAELNHLLMASGQGLQIQGGGPDLFFVSWNRATQDNQEVSVTSFTQGQTVADRMMSFGWYGPKIVGFYLLNQKCMGWTMANPSQGGNVQEIKDGGMRKPSSDLQPQGGNPDGQTMVFTFDFNNQFFFGGAIIGNKVLFLALHLDGVGIQTKKEALPLVKPLPNNALLISMTKIDEGNSFPGVHASDWYGGFSYIARYKSSSDSSSDYSSLTAAYYPVHSQEAYDEGEYWSSFRKTQTYPQYYKGRFDSSGFRYELPTGNAGEVAWLALTPSRFEFKADVPYQGSLVGVSAQPTGQASTSPPTTTAAQAIGTSVNAPTGTASASPPVTGPASAVGIVAAPSGAITSTVETTEGATAIGLHADPSGLASQDVSPAGPGAQVLSTDSVSTGSAQIEVVSNDPAEAIGANQVASGELAATVDTTSPCEPIGAQTTPGGTAEASPLPAETGEATPCEGSPSGSGSAECTPPDGADPLPVDQTPTGGGDQQADCTDGADPVGANTNPAGNVDVTANSQDPAAAVPVDVASSGEASAACDAVGAALAVGTEANPLGGYVLNVSPVSDPGEAVPILTSASGDASTTAETTQPATAIPVLIGVEGIPIILVPPAEAGEAVPCDSASPTGGADVECAPPGAGVAVGTDATPAGTASAVAQPVGEVEALPVEAVELVNYEDLPPLLLDCGIFPLGIVNSGIMAPMLCDCLYEIGVGDTYPPAEFKTRWDMSHLENIKIIWSLPSDTSATPKRERAVRMVDATIGNFFLDWEPGDTGPTEPGVVTYHAEGNYRGDITKVWSSRTDTFPIRKKDHF